MRTVKSERPSPSVYNVTQELIFRRGPDPSWCCGRVAFGSAAYYIAAGTVFETHICLMGHVAAQALWPGAVPLLVRQPRARDRGRRASRPKTGEDHALAKGTEIRRQGILYRNLGARRVRGTHRGIIGAAPSRVIAPAISMAALLVLRLDLLLVFCRQRQKPLHGRKVGDFLGESLTSGDFHEKIDALAADLIR
jgi:hypothetical protein